MWLSQEVDVFFKVVTSSDYNTWYIDKSLIPVVI